MTVENVRLDGHRKLALEMSRNRLVFTGAVFALAFGVIGVRLVDVMALQDGGREPRAESAPAAPLPAERADIVDRNGVVLATSLPMASVYAHPHEVLDPKEAALKLSSVLPDLSVSELEAKLASDRNFVYLRRNLTPRQQYEVNRLGIPGLYFERTEKRVYPQGPLAAHVLGMTDIDNTGIAGVEKTFDEVLRSRKEPLRLSIDVRVQAILRDELAETIGKFSAIGGTAIVQDVRSGAIVGMVSLPDFDPNAPVTNPDALFNRATLGVYEMGSTFKLFNTAIALDTGTTTMRGGYDATQPIKIARFTITDYHAQKRWLSVPEILVHSSNIASVKMALDFGTEKQKEYMGRFGMLRPVSIELPEVGTPMAPHPWREINTMTISFGHGLSVSPLHLVNGVSAIVNGGWLRQPTLIQPQGGVEGPARRAISQRTSKDLRQLMRLVVTEGTGKAADVPGYMVGGKTGTAEKSGGGGYRRKALLSSFVGAFPMNDPRYVVLVMIDEPHGTKETFGFATAGWVAAPATGRIVSRLATALGLPPVEEPEPKNDTLLVKVNAPERKRAAE